MPDQDAHHDLEILVAEDEDLDRFLIENAFAEKRLSNKIRFFENGRLLYDYLQAEISDDTHERYVVLTDLNMPVMSGFELIEAMKQTPKMRNIPIFVLTSSVDDNDVAQALGLGVAGYVGKENAGEDFLACAQMIGKWIKVCTILPV